MLEIALCAQHNNGGIGVNHRWQSAVEGLFVVGEAAATHGVYRPGGSALNAGQVGSTRAAEYIAACRRHSPDRAAFKTALAPALREAQTCCEAALGDSDTLRQAWQNAQARMSRVGAAFRNGENIVRAIDEVRQERDEFSRRIQVDHPNQLYRVFRFSDMLLTQQMYLTAMADYLQVHGLSRGSALYTDADGIHPHPALPEMFTYRLDDGSRADQVQEIRLEHGIPMTRWRRVRPIPQEDDFFENVWRQYRENGCMDN